MLSELILQAAEAKTIFYATPGVWSVVIQVGMIAVFMLIANVLRRQIPFVRKSLMPVSVIAGFMMLAFRLILEKGFKIETVFNKSLLDTVVYHCIALGFIAMSLRVAEKKAERGAAVGARSGALIVGSYLVQGLVGLAVTIGLALTLKPGLFKAAGLLLPMGYGQGPGQANNIGMTYEASGFAGGQSFGLAIAAAGYICACTVGVAVLNFWKKRHLIENVKVDHDKDHEGQTLDYFRSENEIPVSDSIDKLSVQIGLVLVVYLATYLITKGVTSALDKWAPGVGAMLNSMLWGFNFIIGSAIAMLTRTLLGSAERKGVMKRRYQNNYLLNRLSGFFFDLMIVAGIACIDPEDLSGLWLPFVLMAVLGGIATWLYLRFLSRRLYKDYYHEGLISMYGMMTGTIGSGILLLREIDPEFKTPAANNLVIGSSYGILFGAPVLILVTAAAKSDTMCYIVAGIAAVYLVLLTLFILCVKGKKGRKEEKEE
jgi:ESS family glutamate:Na+ symporter